ncbi:hypothetical protein EN825_35645, partial [Mesorhizobium sp. M8A.F.Ca.ET.182.01.1.1]
SAFDHSATSPVRPDYCVRKMIARLFRQEAKKPVGQTNRGSNFTSGCGTSSGPARFHLGNKRGVLMAQTKLNVVEDTIENQIAELRSQIASLS